MRKIFNMKKAAFILAFIMIFSTFAFALGDIATAQEPTLIWELTDEEVDLFLADMESHPFLRPASSGGRPEYSRGENGGIHMTNRNADWQSLDIRDDWMTPGMVYTIFVEFQSDVQTMFRIMNTDSPYATLIIAAEPAYEATLEYVYVTGIVEGQRGYRLTTPFGGGDPDYTVLSIRIYEGGDAGGGQDTFDLSLPSLYRIFRDYFFFGNIMDPGLIDNYNVTSMFLHHYNSVTAENAMKPAYIAPSRDDFRFSGPDNLVNWAIDNNIVVHGHTLVWHSQSAPWLNEDENGEPLSRAEARDNMEYFINRYAGHFAGRIRSWDVVNEAFRDGVSGTLASEDWRSALRTNSPWFIAYEIGMDEAAGECPSDYIYDAFVFARLADPNAILVYNDFNEEQPGKREAMAGMTEEFNERWRNDERNTEPDRLLIEVLGMQAHYWEGWLDVDDVRATIERFIQTGARVAITELDIPIGTWNNFGERTDEALERQAQLYGDLFRIFVEFADYIDSVTIWGRADHQSWRAQGFPLIFDGHLQAKPAYWSIVEVLYPEIAEAGRAGLPVELPNRQPPVDEPADDTEDEIEADTGEPQIETQQDDDFEWWLALIIGVPLAVAVVVLGLVLRKRV